jgi:hypothetical protein
LRSNQLGKPITFPSPRRQRQSLAAAGFHPPVNAALEANESFEDRSGDHAQP